MTAEALHLAAILCPFLLVPLAGWFRRQAPGRAGYLAFAPAMLAIYFVGVFRSVAIDGPFVVSVRWAPSLGLSLAFRFDGLSLLFAVLICAIGSVVVLYASRYLDHQADSGRFQATLFAFMGSMLGVVLSDNLIGLFVFWELTGLTSYLLIGFEHQRQEARRAALQALLVTGAGGLGLLAATVMIGRLGQSFSFSALLDGDALIASGAAHGFIVVLVLLAAFTKSAQFPFHFWLPNAMQAPTPVSAYLHSATMVKAGVYLVARMTPLIGGSALWNGTLVIIGTATLTGAAYRAILETDLKRVLAYSTVSTLGALMLMLGIGTPRAVAASLTYLVAHSCYKGALFLVAGAVDHESGTRDVTALGGLGRHMPMTAIAAGLAAASMAGVPFSIGFVAKEQFYDSIRDVSLSVPGSIAVSAAAVAGSALLGAAGLVASVAPFVGVFKGPRGVHEVPAAMWFGPLLLASAGLLAGIGPGLLDLPLGLAAEVVRGGPPLRRAIWHGFSLTLLLSAATLLGSFTLFVLREPIRRRAWPRALGTERLYTHTLAGLHAVSRLVAPALQGASLRFYVLTVVAALVGLVGTALITARVMPALSRWTPIQLHEAAVAALIVAAAVSAARSRSVMTAVLSLGTVGYGVALIYVLFGAPDLGMTQFAVETLTVVIFVLVFRQMSGFGDLSPARVKVRDAIIATAAGALIAVLVLFIGASGTTSRLSAYFADAAPRLGHGRNVVNVILVDFRAFDTLGEITVLVTVAVGVGALLRIAGDRQA